MMKCSNCGTPIIGESPGGDPAQRRPCPRCGSLVRTFEYVASGSITPSGSATAVFISYPEALLTVAKELIESGKFNISVVVAHMACEICAERTLSQAFKAKGIGNLEDPIEAFLSGHNLANGRFRKLYNAVTGDQIHNEHFWNAFKESAGWRNQVVHKGRIVSKLEAETSLQAATDLVAYLQRVPIVVKTGSTEE